MTVKSSRTSLYLFGISGWPSFYILYYLLYSNPSQSLLGHAFSQCCRNLRDWQSTGSPAWWILYFDFLLKCVCVYCIFECSGNLQSKSSCLRAQWLGCSSYRLVKITSPNQRMETPKSIYSRWWLRMSCLQGEHGNSRELSLQKPSSCVSFHISTAVQVINKQVRCWWHFSDPKKNHWDMCKYFSFLLSSFLRSLASFSSRLNKKIILLFSF